MTKLKVIVVGESWNGSNCTGLARGFRGCGHAVDLIGLETFFPTVDRSLLARGMRRALSPFYRDQFNRRLLSSVRSRRPDLVVVYKGTAVRPATLAEIRKSSVWLCFVMPDITWQHHWLLDSRIFGYFDHIFTTKEFGVEDFKTRLNVRSVSLLPHGYDPTVHRPLTLDSHRHIGNARRPISFIGTWSLGKERTLAHLAAAVSPDKLNIWGDGWGRVAAPVLQPSIRGEAVFGDFYAAAITETRINLGLLSERVPGSVSGDQVTSRTFHIPACGGFLLHKRTAELANFYKEGREIACFESCDELVEKVRYYLDHEAERAQIARAGYSRCIRDHSLKNRAEAIVEKFLARESAQRPVNREQ